MKKVILLMAIAVVSVLSLNAQTSKPMTFNIGIEPALPVGTFGDVYSFGIGASLQGDYHVAPGTALTASVGYNNYSIKSSFGGGSTGFVPVLGGVEFNLSPKVFGSAQLGASFGTAKGAGAAFTYAPGLGVNLGSNIKALLKYQAMSKNGGTLGEVALRLSYSF